MKNRQLLYQAPHVAAIRSAALREPAPGEARLRLEYSALSRGTERLVFEGRIPESEFERMRAPFQEGDFPFPVVYGYAAAGIVEAGPPEWVGRRAFALSPHQEYFIGPITALTPLPAETPVRRAPLAANLETALNGLWDGGFAPGDRVAVVGAGVLGGLVAALAAATPGAEVLLVDVAPERAKVAAALGARFATPGEAAGYDADLVLHTSATEPGLQEALALAGDEATVVELSWFGDGAPALPLGAAFHSRRLRLVSSQVGRTPADRRGRWPNARRLAKALDVLADPRFDRFLGEETPLEALPDALPRLLGAGAPFGAALVRYDGAGQAGPR